MEKNEILSVTADLVRRPDTALGGAINDGSNGEYIAWMSSCGHPTKIYGRNLPSGWRLTDDGEYICWGRPGMADNDCIILNNWVFATSIDNILDKA